MKKWMLPFAILGLGAVGSGALQQAAQQFRTAAAASREEWRGATNTLAVLERESADLRTETSRKQAELAQISKVLNLSPELREWLRSGAKSDSKLDANLRQQLGIGWNSSPDYVLVSKATFKNLSFGPLTENAQNGPSATAVAYFGMSAAERAGIASALLATRNESIAKVERVEPAGDVVAQYNMQLDSNAAAAVSNQFFSKISEALGTVRAEAFCPGAWGEVASAVGPCAVGPVTLTVRQVSENGEADLMWEIKQGGRSSAGLVRAGVGPGRWFEKAFPGGWLPVLEREGIATPKAFNDN